jgi:phosphoglucosamine mutase
MALIAIDHHRREALMGNAVVSTVMSNLGLERRLAEEGIALERTQVGDRYVLEAMRARGRNVGGEQSGHIILSDHSTTGDGLVAGLQVLAALIDQDKPASELLHLFEPVPQLLKNVRYSHGAPLDDAAVKAVIAEAEAKLAGRGRLVIRKSGTEPLIRVMAEGDDLAMVETLVDGICDAVRVAAG